jgi:tRNASer (uridine44-2'-O)-methyltransferase
MTAVSALLPNSRSSQDTDAFCETLKQSLFECSSGRQSNGVPDIVIDNFAIQEDELRSNIKKDDRGNELTVSLRCLIPKRSNKFSKILEVTFIDCEHCEAIFVPIGQISADSLVPCLKMDDGMCTPTELVYRVCFSSQSTEHKNRISLFTIGKALEVKGESVGCSCAWLVDTLLTKLANWSKESELNTEVTSLVLVSVKTYSEVYLRLKEKYGQQLVKSWTEKTDPQKFVYEDIGIAAYLIVLWEDERKAKGLANKQSFVDLGCGNGLLVYLLTMEGYTGVGLDVRKRQIWDVLGQVATLKECTVTPSDNMLFPEYDWLIGNHSDELTPWIPVIAARSHYNCRYFVLPCCSWDFNCKFAAKGPGTSQYQGYLNFVAEVGRQCGFKVERDVLRIPSTKRTCFVGKSRTYSATEEKAANEQRTNYIKLRCRNSPSCGTDNTTKSSPTHDDSGNVELDEHIEEREKEKSCYDSITIKNSTDVTLNDSWISGFKPRDAVEMHRNAGRLSRMMKDHVVITTFRKLLESKRCPIDLPDKRVWNKGDTIHLTEISALLDRETLYEMKKECGGLQTVLKNCPDVFTIRGSRVSLRDWTSSDYTSYQQSRRKKRRIDSASERLKTKLCFYFVNHPDQCPLTTESCRFAHGLDDIRS